MHHKENTIDTQFLPTPGVPKHVGRELCIDCVYFMVHEKLVR